MLHLVTHLNRELYASELDDLHRARKAVFVDELGWRLRVRDGMESDEYDDSRAMHIIGFGVANEVAMGIRIRPADDKSMLADHFSSFVRPGCRPFNDGRTWEVSRGFCRERGLRRPHLMRKAACMISPLEIALAAGVDRYIGFTDIRMLALYSHIGWKLTFLGDAMPYGEGDGVAYEAEVSQEVVCNIRQTWGLPAPAYVQLEGLDGAADVHEAGAKIAGQDPRRFSLMAPAAKAAPDTSSFVRRARMIAASHR